jgi:hypothetical protein
MRLDVDLAQLLCDEKPVFAVADNHRGGAGLEPCESEYRVLQHRAV